MKKNPKTRAENLPDFRGLYIKAFGMDEHKHENAADFFGVSAAECETWYNGKPHPAAHRYLSVHCKGYLPYNTHWSDCYINLDGMVITPWGNCRPSDIAFFHRNKWANENTRHQLAKCREKLSELQTGAKMKMLLHTADYLNRLVKDLTSVDS